MVPAGSSPLFAETVYLLFDNVSGAVVGGQAAQPPSSVLSAGSRAIIQQRLESEFGPYGVRFQQGSWQSCGSGQLAIAFRGYSPAYYGTAGSPAPLAIVYVDTIRRNCCGLLALPGEFEEWIADVAGHELGHLLGYQHVSDRTDIMSTGWNRGTKGDVRFRPFAQQRSRSPTRPDICLIGAAVEQP